MIVYFTVANTRNMIVTTLFLLILLIDAVTSSKHIRRVSEASLASNTTTDTADGDEARIVGGVIAGDDEYPFFVSLRYRDHHWCGGSLLTGGEYVLTAAHCIDRTDVMVQEAIVSSYKSKPDQKNYPTHAIVSVTEQFVHPEYDKNSKRFDVALVKIFPPVRNVWTVRINTDGSLPSPGMPLVAIGLGDVDPTEIYQGAETLRKVTVNAYNYDDCQRMYGFPIDRSSMVCAKDIGKDTCRGDSGGPLFSNGVVYGVTSFGAGCGKAHPGVYSRASSFSTWVCKTASGACSTAEAPACEDDRNWLCIWLRNADSWTRTFYCSGFASARRSCRAACESCV